MLEELTTHRHTIEKKNPGKAKGTITKAVNAHKEEMVKKLLDTAKELHCTTGKVVCLWPPKIFMLTSHAVDAFYRTRGCECCMGSDCKSYGEE